MCLCHTQRGHNSAQQQAKPANPTFPTHTHAHTHACTPRFEPLPTRLFPLPSHHASYSSPPPPPPPHPRHRLLALVLSSSSSFCPSASPRLRLLSSYSSRTLLLRPHRAFFSSFTFDGASFSSSSSSRSTPFQDVTIASIRLRHAQRPLSTSSTRRLSDSALVPACHRKHLSYRQVEPNGLNHISIVDSKGIELFSIILIERISTFAKRQISMSTAFA